MRVEITPTESMKIKIVWNGVVVKEEDIAAGQEYKLVLGLPENTNGTAQVIGIYGDGTEALLGSVTYTVDTTQDTSASCN